MNDTGFMSVEELTSKLLACFEVEWLIVFLIV